MALWNPITNTGTKPNTGSPIFDNAVSNNVNTDSRGVVISGGGSRSRSSGGGSSSSSGGSSSSSGGAVNVSSPSQYTYFNALTGQTVTSSTPPSGNGWQSTSASGAQTLQKQYQQKQYDASGGTQTIQTGTSVVGLKPQSQVEISKTKEQIKYEEWSALTDEQKRISVGGSRAQAGAQTEMLRQQARLSIDPAAKERLGIYGAIQAGVVGAALAPIVFGTGLIGTTVGGLSSFVWKAAVGTTVGKATANTIFESPLTYNERKYFGQQVDARMSKRISEEGLNLPLLNKEQEKVLTGGNWIPFVGSVGNLVNELPGGRLGSLTSTTNEYYKVLKEAGYEDSKALEIAKKETIRESIGGGFGEAVSLGGFGQGVGEISGSAAQKGIAIVTKAEGAVMSVAKARTYGAVSGTIGGGFGGFVETAISYPQFQAGRYREVTPEGYANALVWGTGTAAVAGGVVGVLTGKPTTQKVVYGGFSALEAGQEYAGDYLKSTIKGANQLDVFLNIAGEGTKKLPSKTNAFGWNLSNSTSIYNESNRSVNLPTAQSSQGFMPGNINPNLDLTKNKDLIIIDNTVPVKPNDVVPTINNNNNNNFTNVNNSIYNETTTETNTSTATNAMTYFPTFTPVITAPGFPLGGLPNLSGDAFGGGQGSAARKRSKYYDEWGTALGIYAESNRYQNSLMTGQRFYSNKQITGQQKLQARKELKIAMQPQAKRQAVGKQFTQRYAKPKGLFSAVNIFKI